MDACKYYYGIISQYAAQYLPPPTTKSKTYNIKKFYHKHLQDGFRTDAVSGWLLYASYYYVTGQYSVTLRLTEYVLSRCKHDMVHVDRDNRKEENINNYRRKVHSKTSLNDRIKLATVDLVTYMWHSSLIPGELQLEVENQPFCIPPTVLSYCLRFLFHHHLGNMLNRQQALHNLHLIVRDDYSISLDDLSESETILGVCHEISGNKISACQFYDKAMHNNVKVCRSSKARKSTPCVAET
ncbi:unnamed protein product [Mytilus coruscus]|uniref:Uncharacterized protein n=1 Tax=Mytilus coruscus TaxID=42192 RepID=A0A6J8C3A6_MYTCO|nr:unnamed protein product [Mytilus coruscus]